jgi:O-antigen/teichoic acid export membrane protein
MIAPVAELKKAGGMADPIVLSSGVGRLVSTITAPITAVLVVVFLSPEEQGYWFAFLGMVTMTNYAEMGMGQVILQFAAHEAGKSGEEARDQLSNDNGRLKSILRISLIFGGLAALLQFAMALPLGYAVFSSRAAAAKHIEWLGPWVLLCLAAPLNLALVFVNSFLEGCQFIVGANLRRALQAVAQVVVMLLTFSLGGRLWSLGAGLLASFAAGLIWVAVAHGGFLSRLLSGFRRNREVSWRKEVWPLQWRYAMTWTTGLFVYGLFNPLIFLFAGEIAAGQFGFTMSVVGVVLAYSQVWTASRAAVFARLNGAANWDELKRLFDRSIKYGAMAYLLGAACVLMALYVINANLPRLAVRFLDPLATVVLLAGGGVNLATFFITYFVRSFKEEPFVKLAWAIAALMVVLLPVGTYLFGTRGAAAAYLVSQSAVLPVALGIYNHYRRRMQLQSSFGR